MSLSRQQLEGFLQLFELGDYARIANQFVPDGIFVDALFPTRVMQGREVIQTELQKVMRLIEHSTFEIQGFWQSDQAACAEVKTMHRYKGGLVAQYTQMMVVNSNATHQIIEARLYHSLSIRDIPNVLKTGLFENFNNVKNRLMSRVGHG